LINSNNNDLAQAILGKNGYEAEKYEGSLLSVSSEKAIEMPGSIAEIMVNAGCPPSLLKVEEEDLETYFLRIISKKGGPE
jgi:ABC-2 type transport system ATP-binding protein